MNKLKQFWYKKQNSSHDLLDEIDQVLLLDNHEHKYSSRSINTRLFIRIYHWTCTHKILTQLITCIFIPVLLYIFLIMLSTNQAFIPKEFQENHHRLLLIAAHPDDECLFFSPTLRILQTQHHVNTSLLILSRGNHVGLGEIRARELHGSCRALNIPQERCISLDLSYMQDDPKIWWSEKQIIPLINEYIRLWSIDFVVSFDDYGISGHMNHRAIASAVRLLVQNKTNTMIKMSYELKSVSVLRKYSSLMDFYFVFLSFIPRLLHSFFSYIIPFNLISSPDVSRILLVNTPNDYMASRAAFASHQTQYNWDRHIYLIASRYMFINELKKIE
ncbi:unnamed protein product [Adineta steineri]|uniref:N-acetylglucosaminylphosphatidylinositol deacetylase n=1 Tax=Adineta steineri TaxID=433720 RepID=A0A814AC83_9BILA|nr:unnamed protein product [Adineta steineri]CAF1396169.1 unnamed protein product [Adineta steineri]CAF1397092.1 unnamed protein product [Adineta steineri]